MPGFSVHTASSVAGVHEFEAFHQYYWADPRSNFVKGSVCVHRITADRGVLSLRGCTLRRSLPGLSDGKTYEVIDIACSSDAWFGLLRDLFFMPLEDLSEEERGRLWVHVSSQHAAWLAAHHEAQEATSRLEAGGMHGDGEPKGGP